MFDSQLPKTGNRIQHTWFVIACDKNLSIEEAAMKFSLTLAALVLLACWSYLHYIFSETNCGWIRCYFLCDSGHIGGFHPWYRGLQWSSLNLCFGDCFIMAWALIQGLVTFSVRLPLRIVAVLWNWIIVWDCSWKGGAAAAGSWNGRWTDYGHCGWAYSLWAALVIRFVYPMDRVSCVCVLVETTKWL